MSEDPRVEAAAWAMARLPIEPVSMDMEGTWTKYARAALAAADVVDPVRTTDYPLVECMDTLRRTLARLDVVREQRDRALRVLYDAYAKSFDTQVEDNTLAMRRIIGSVLPSEPPPWLDEIKRQPIFAPSELPDDVAAALAPEHQGESEEGERG